MALALIPYEPHKAHMQILRQYSVHSSRGSLNTPHHDDRLTLSLNGPAHILDGLGPSASVYILCVHMYDCFTLQSPSILQSSSTVLVIRVERFRTFYRKPNYELVL